MPKLHELLETRATAVAEMRTLTDKAEVERRDLTETEDGRFKELRGKVEDLDRQIERARFLADAERSAPAILHHGTGDGRFEERARQFSLTKAITAQIQGGVDAGFEREISQEVARRSGRKFQGIAVPDQYLEVRSPVTAATEGAALIPNVHRPDMYVDKLRAALLTERLGATVLDNLVGDVDIPKAKAGSTASWVAEDGSITEGAPDFQDVTLRPKTVGGIVSYTRRTLINAAPSIENILRADLAKAIAGAIDAAAIIADGTGNTPKGIVAQTGIHTVTMAAGPTWAKILDHIASVQAASAEGPNMAWAADPYAVRKMRAALKESGDAAAGYIMTTANALADYPLAVSAALPGDGKDPAGTPAGTPSTLVFGDWSNLLVAYWSGLDILVNPYETTAFGKARVLIRALRDVDVAVRHVEAFSVTTDLKAA